MHMNHDKAQKKGLLGKIKVFCDGAEVKQALEFMTGKGGFVHYYYSPVRVIGDCAQVGSMRGNVTCVIE